MPLIKLNKILVCCHLFHEKLGLQSDSANLCLNAILSSPYYLGLRQSQIQYMCLSFQIDSPLQLNTYNIYQPLITTFSNFFGEGKEIESKLHSIVLLPLW